MRAHPVFNTMPHTQTSSYQKPTMVMSLHHHGNNNQTQTWKQMNPSECVTKWNLDGNSKQPFPKINKTNIQLQLNSKASKDQVWLKHKHSNSFHLIIISYFKFISSNHNIYPILNSFHLIIILILIQIQFSFWFILLIQFKIIPFWCTAGQWGCETQPHIYSLLESTVLSTFIRHFWRNFSHVEALGCLYWQNYDFQTILGQKFCQGHAT